MRALGPQQAAVYAAEAAALTGAGRVWRRLAGAQAYVDGLLEDEWFCGRWGHLLRCTLERRGSGARWSAAHPLDAAGPGGRPTEAVILIAPGGLNQATVLHELAHLLAPPDIGHGPPFVGVMLELVRREMGFVAFTDFLHALRRTEAFATLAG